MIKRFYILLTCLLTALAGCQGDGIDDDARGADTIGVRLALAYGQPEGTRMAQTDVQANANFLGIDNLHLIPYDHHRAITAADVRNHAPLYGVNAFPSWAYAASQSRAYENVYVPRGTASFLVYGKSSARTADTPALKFQYGSTIATGLDAAAGTPSSDIGFAPEPLLAAGEKAALDAVAEQIRAYLTSVVRTSYWYSSTYTNNRARFTEFTLSGQVFSPSQQALTTLLNTAYNGTFASTTWRTYIRNAINASAYGVTCNGTTVTFPAAWQDFFARIPAGVYALRYVGASTYAFQLYDAASSITAPLNQTITPVERYCYPAQLWYYANSQIKTSEDDMTSSYGASSWPDVMALAGWQHTTMMGGIQSLAVVSPLQYGMGLMKLRFRTTEPSLAREGSSSGISITTSDTKYLLTGVFVDSQHPQHFNFTPSSLATNFLAYDKTFGTGNYYLRRTNWSDYHYMLVYPTDKDEPVKIILEFTVQSSGTAFNTMQIAGTTRGYVPVGGKFYLVGEIDPAKASSTPDGLSDDAKGRVFSADHVTNIDVTVSDLKNAYPFVPDVSNPMLIFSLGVNLSWDLSTPETVVMY